MTIKRNHPARKAVCDLATYYDSKGALVQAVDAVLNEHGWRLDYHQTMDMFGDNGGGGYTILPNVDEPTEEIGIIVIHWHRMDQSGRFELTTYIA
jgi:hypothetical protein